MIVFPLVIGAALAVPNPNPAPADQAAPVLASSVVGMTAAILQEEEAVTAPDGAWHGSLDVGLSKSDGNADIETYAINGKAIRESGPHRYTADVLWYYATQDDVRTQRRALGTFKYDQFVAEKTYFYVNALAETNEQAMLDLRWTAGAGIGQQWRDDDQWKFHTEIGLGWFDEEFDNGDMIDYGVVRLAWDLVTQITSTLTFGNGAEVYPSLDDKDDVYGLMSTYFETVISESMTAKLSWILTYDNTPALDASGQPLERADNIYLLTVGWNF